MNESGMEGASTGLSPDSLCPRCGLPIGQRGSFTYWIFKEYRCQCESGLGSPDETGKAAQNVVSKQILNDRYQVLECVGRGGMGFVYRAVDLVNNEVVALKVMRPDLAQSDVAVKRVMREVEVVSHFSNSNLGQVYGYGQEKGGSPYLVMEFVSGKNLEDILHAEGKLSLQRAVDLFMQIAAGLICAHTNGIIHRDLKSSNVIVTKDTHGSEHVKIVDFGFARLMRDASTSTRLTQDGEVFGSPAYMSPEQCLGEELDVRSDIYSLGCLMYECLTGTPPLVGENVLATVAKHIRVEPQSMQTHDPSIPEGIDSIVLKCLSKEPQLRYQTASDLRQDLDKVKRGEHIKAPHKRSHDAVRNEQRSENRRALRVSEGVNQKMATMTSTVLVVAILIGCVAGASVWMLLPKPNVSNASAGEVVSHPVSQGRGEPAANSSSKSQPSDPVSEPVSNSSASSHETAIAKHSGSLTHNSRDTHVAHAGGTKAHAFHKQHTNSSSSSGSSGGWDALKGLRVHR